MKKLWVILFILLLSTGVMASDTPNKDPQVLITVPSTGWDDESLNTAINELTNYDISFLIAKPEPSVDERLSGVAVLPLDDAVESLSANTTILIIGGDTVDSLIASASLLNATQNAHKNGAVLAAIGNGALVLAKAGVLSGVKTPSPEDARSQNLLSESGAILEKTEGVITDSIITAQSSDVAKTWMEVIIREVIARQMTDDLGVLYLGDQEDGRSVYIIPERLSKQVISAVSEGEFVDEWSGEPVGAPDMNKTYAVPTGLGDWAFSISPGDSVCLLSDQFTGLSVPFGTVVHIDTQRLGKKRDFSTNTVPIEEMIQDVTFKDAYQDSEEYSESNKTLRNWTIEINNTNSSVKKSVALLFDDIRIAEMLWEDLTLRACIEGNGVGKGILDILKMKGDSDSSLAYDEEEVTGSGCYEVLLSVDAPKGITAYLTLFGKEGNVLREEEINIP